MKKNEKLIYKNVDKNFFDLDEEKKLSLVKLQFDKPSDIFDLSFVTKKPIVNDEFAQRIEDSFLAVPRHYKLDFEIMYKDLEGYTEEELKTFSLIMRFLEQKKVNVSHLLDQNLLYGF